MVEATNLGAINIFIEPERVRNELALSLSDNLIVLVLKISETLRLVVVLQIASIKYPSIFVN